MAMKFKNNAATTLASSINASATSLTVLTGQGALFPTIVDSSDYFYCTLANTLGIVEIIKVTGRTGDNFTTIVRAQDNTSAVSWNAGDKVELRLVAACLNDIPKLDEPWTINSSPGTNGQVLTSRGSISSPVWSTLSVPVSSVFGRTGAVTLTSSDVSGALGYTPYDSSNPSGYITTAGSCAYASNAGTLNGYAYNALPYASSDGYSSVGGYRLFSLDTNMYATGTAYSGSIFGWVGTVRVCGNVRNSVDGIYYYLYLIQRIV